MGRMKGRHVRTLAIQLLARYSFSEDLQKNKQILNAMKLMQESKKEFNKLAGELTTLVKRQVHELREKEARAFTAVTQPAAAQQVA